MSSHPELAAIMVNAARAHMSAGGNLLSGNIGVQNIHFNLSGPQAPQEVDLKRIKPCPPPSRVFTGREDALRRMREYFLSPSGDPASRVFVLHGLGGAGKTQIARKFIHDAVSCSGGDATSAYHAPIVLVADASSAQNLETSLKDVAVVARIGENAADLIAWLTRHKESWFLLLDNADDCDLDLHTYIPFSRHGNVIITTRNSEAPAQYTDRLPRSNCRVSDMDSQDARLLLRTVTRLTDSSKDDDLDALAQEVGYLALAIAQAGSAICRWKLSVQQYLEELRARRSEIFRDDGTRPQGVDGYHATVYTTWRMSYDRLSPLARQWFQICSFLHNTHISEDIFRMAAAELPSFQPLPGLPVDEHEQKAFNNLGVFLSHFQRGHVWDEVQFRTTLGELSSYSFIEHFGGICHIHPLVHQWTQGLVSDQHLEMSTMFLIALCNRNMDAGFNLVALLGTIHHVEHAIQTHLTHDQLPICVAIQFRDMCMKSGRHMQAGQMAQFAIQKAQKTVGECHLWTLELMGSSFWMFHMLGQLGEAEEMQKHLVERCKTTLGEDHPYTLNSMENLVWTLQELGQLREAKEMQRHVVERQKVVFGDDHEHTLCSLHNLVSILGKLGQFKEIEEIQRQTVKRWIVSSGEDHPGTLDAMHNLGATLKKLGQVREAEEIQRHVVERRKALLGEDHSDTLSSLQSLGLILSQLGQLREAEAMERDVVERQRIRWGEDHPYTLFSMSNLTLTLHRSGQLQEAETLLRHVIKLRIKVLGENHPDTCTSKKFLFRRVAAA